MPWDSIVIFRLFPFQSGIQRPGMPWDSIVIFRLFPFQGMKYYCNISTFSVPKQDNKAGERAFSSFSLSYSWDLFNILRPCVGQNFPNFSFLQVLFFCTGGPHNSRTFYLQICLFMVKKNILKFIICDFHSTCLEYVQFFSGYCLVIWNF